MWCRLMGEFSAKVKGLLKIPRGLRMYVRMAAVIFWGGVSIESKSWDENEVVGGEVALSLWFKFIQSLESVLININIP